MTIDLQKAREFSDKVIGWVRGKGKILIVAHDNPDPDSLASAFALAHLLLLKTGQESTIAFGGVIGRGENRALVSELEIKAIPMEELDLSLFPVVCMVDTQPGTGNNSYPVDRPVHVVIDHHPSREICDSCRWVDVRPEYGACATILFEYLQAQEIYLGTKLATMLYYAIKSETQDLGREWTRADREAYLHLFPLANNRILFNITHPESPREYFLSFNQALESARIYGDLLVFNLYAIDNPDMVAEMADFLLRMEGVTLVLGMGNCRDKEILSLRTTDLSVNAGEVIQEVVAGLGTAGGHGMTAGGQINPLQGDRAVQKELENTLVRRLLETLGKTPCRPKRLVPS
jgi:nanoRNase/pAp phosphatase (c-di-AMP/oligoRNAs hydrolase)